MPIIDTHPFKDLRVILLHDWLTGFRGGERVLESLCEMFPKAPLYTLVHKKGSSSPLIEDRKIVTSFLNGIPGIHQHYRKFLPLFPLAIESMRPQEEGKLDLVISSSHCVIKGFRKRGTEKHIAYIHTPMRYIYDQFDIYFGGETPRLQRWAAQLVRPYLQTWDKNSNDHIDVMIANSAFVKERVIRSYQRDALVVHPFVDLVDFEQVQLSPPERENYFVMVTAFAPNKRVDMAIEAFNQLDRPLKIVGDGQLENKLKKMAGPKIEFLGNLPRENIVSLLSRAQALIFPGVEDFGIVPLEALAAGTPVIAFRAGGVLETLDEKVAVFFDEGTPRSLMDAIIRFDRESLHFSRKELHERARIFSKKKFQENIARIIRDVFQWV